MAIDKLLTLKLHQNWLVPEYHYTKGPLLRDSTALVCEGK